MEDFSAVRRQYAELIRHRADLRSDRLVKALSEVPREDYLARTFGLFPMRRRDRSRG